MDAGRARIAELAAAARRLPVAERRAFLDGFRLDPDVRQQVDAALRQEATVAWSGTEPPGPDAPGPAPATVASAALDPSSSPEAVARSMDPLLGRTLGAVHVERIIGSGGMGRVYLGTDASSGDRVALKVLLRTQQDEATRRRFEREGRLLERLRHPGIAAVLRTGVERDGDLDIPYIVMEYVDGVQHLADHVFRERLGMRETVQVFLQACDAVAHAHAEGYVHRDIKPQNLLVDRHGRVKVIDFGVARAVTADPAVNTIRTETGQIVGTMQYMSPEQFLADPRMIDARTDVYALGAVLYELLTGVQPHDLRGLPVHEASRTVCETDPADVRECNPRIDDGLAQVVMDAVARAKDRRPDDARALGLRLRGWLAAGGTTSGQGGAAGPTHGVPAAGSVRMPPTSARDHGAATRSVAGPAPVHGRGGGWWWLVALGVLVVAAMLIAFGVVRPADVLGRMRGAPVGDAPAGDRPSTRAPSGATPAAAAPRVVELRVMSAPAGASVTVDGEPRGVTPAVVLVPDAASVHRVAVEHAGWGSWTGSWRSADAPLIVANLDPPGSYTGPLPRVAMLVVKPLPAGSTLRLVSPAQMTLGAGTWGVPVQLAPDGARWSDAELVLEAADRDGRPAPIRAGARSGVGRVIVPVGASGSGAPVEVSVGRP
ncbi:MAG: Serine/threonine-protein kinase PrkC [Planctomycetota bacterium]